MGKVRALSAGQDRGVVMPQLALLMVAGAGLVAGYKWVAKEVHKHAEALERARAEAEARQAAAAPRDQGALIWDAGAGEFRPRNG